MRERSGKEQLVTGTRQIIEMNVSRPVFDDPVRGKDEDASLESIGLLGARGRRNRLTCPHA
jgi:hypothetical protein